MNKRKAGQGAQFEEANLTSQRLMPEEQAWYYCRVSLIKTEYV